ncbi:MAG TPA: PIN domain-containing protein [Armatimonadota bacterium]|jgi:predicted nucleic acid-binding protein
MRYVPRVYADTSVFGGVFDEEFEDASQRFVSLVEHGRFALVTSALVEDEIRFAPLRVQDLFERLRLTAEIIDITADTLDLRSRYVEAGVVAARSWTDALHVAAATTSRCDFIVSWNFKHIVHFDKVPRYNAVNVLCGYHEIGIHSPLEMVSDEEEDF